LLDGLTSAFGSLWTLQGPRGAEFAGRDVIYSDAAWSADNGDNYSYWYNSSRSALALPVGDYALSIGIRSGYNAAYGFKLVDASSLAPLTLGEAISTQRSPANATIGYRVAALAGDAVLLAVNQDSSAQGYSDWKLYAMDGSRISGDYSDLGRATFKIPMTGDYVLVDEGRYYDTGTASVSFKLSRQSITLKALVLNDVISGNLLNKTSTDAYSFELNEATVVTLDTLLPGTYEPYWGGYNVNWKLEGSGGTVVNWTTFYDSGDRTMALKSGKYTLSVRAPGDAASPYQFRLVTSAVAEVVSIDSPVMASFPAVERKLYKFNATAGESFSLQSERNGSYQYWDPYFSVYDPYGRQVTQGAGYSGRVTIPAAYSGEYLIEFRSQGSVYGVYNATTQNLQFTLYKDTVVQQTLSLDTLVSGAISQSAQSQNYSFTLNAPTRVLIDTGSAASGTAWALKGPRGQEATGRAFGTGTHYFDLPIGRYDLTVARPDIGTGNYALRVLSLDAASTLAGLPDAQQITLDTVTGRSTVKVVVAQDSELIYQTLSSTLGGVSWQLLNVKGVVVQSGNANSNKPRFAVNAGTYYLVFTGTQNTSTAQQASFKLITSITSTALSNLGLNQSIIDSLAQPGNVREYRFRTTQPTTVWLDSQTNSADVVWDLTGPLGSLRSGIALNQATELASASAIALDAPGEYVLRVYSQTSASASYTFQLLDLNVLNTLALGSAQATNLSSGSAAKAYAINALGGEYFSFDTSAIQGGAARAWLFDPTGLRVMVPTLLTVGSSLKTLLTKTGRYVLVVDGVLENTTDVVVSWQASTTPGFVSPLALGANAMHTLLKTDVPDAWAFSVAATSRIVLEGQGNTGTQWQLRRPNGALVATGDIGQLTQRVLEAGSYQLQVSAADASALGDWSM
jgi:hypothetical protein